MNKRLLPTSAGIMRGRGLVRRGALPARAAALLHATAPVRSAALPVAATLLVAAASLVAPAAARSAAAAARPSGGGSAVVVLGEHGVVGIARDRFAPSPASLPGPRPARLPRLAGAIGYPSAVIARAAAASAPRAVAPAPRAAARASQAAAPAPPRPRGKSKAERALRAALTSALRGGHIDRARYRRYLGIWTRARATARTLRRRGIARKELSAVLRSVERLALAGRLIPSRLPLVFLELEVNERFWRSSRAPAARAWVEPQGSELLFAYFPGEGIRFHPLGTFKRANLLHAACVKALGEPCQRERLARLLDEAAGVASQRSKSFRAWEYMFRFGGGNPPWISGMAQATALQAYARAAKLLGRPDYLRIAARTLGAFATPAPLGVVAKGPLGSTHYLQYSFAPRLFIFNAFTQAVIGLHDFAQLAGDTRAARFAETALGELRAEIPHSDIGDWSLYSWQGRPSTPAYHELLWELVASACTRGMGEAFCSYADRFRRYQTEPPRIDLLQPPDEPTTQAQPPLVEVERTVAIRFRLSKLSAVEFAVTRGKRTLLRSLTTLSRGTWTFRWRPRTPGSYALVIAAKELRTGRGLRARRTLQLEAVAPEQSTDDAAP